MTAAETIYRKVGRKYVPVGYNDPSYFNIVNNGSHLVTVSPGGRHIRYNVEPAAAPLLAALSRAETAMVRVLLDATSAKLRVNRLSETEVLASQAYTAIAGSDMHPTFDGPSIQSAVDAFKAALIELVGAPTALTLSAEYAATPEE